MFGFYDPTNMEKERIVPGVDLQRIREAANLTRKELAAKLGDGGYKAGNVTLYETESRYVGLTLLKRWARACGHQFHIVFDQDPALLLPRPAAPQLPTGWFIRPVPVKRRTPKRHYDPGTGRSVCGSCYSKGASIESRAHEHPDDCQRCARGRHLLGIVLPYIGPDTTPV